MATLVELTGFEWGSAVPISSTHDGIWSLGGESNCTVSYPTATTVGSHSGYSLRFQVTAASGWGYRTLSIPGTNNVLVASFYLRVGALPSASTAAIFALGGSGAGTYMELGLSSAGVLQGRIVNTDGWSSLTDSLSTGTWYRIDVRADWSGTTWQLDMQVDGGTTRTITQGGHAATNNGTGATPECDQAGTGATSADIYFDDLIVSATTGDWPLGAHKVKVRRPTADGTHSNGANFTDGTSAVDASTNPSYVELDDSPWPTSGSTDYILQTANGSGDYVEQTYADVDSEDTAVLGVICRAARNSASTTAHTAGALMLLNSVEYTMWGKTVAWASNAVQAEKTTVVTNPTVANTNGLVTRFGYSGDAAPDPRILCFMVEYAATQTAATPTVPPRSLAVLQATTRAAVI